MRVSQYPASLYHEVRHLHDSGWTVSQIRRLLQRDHATVPSTFTLYQWVNPEYRERSRVSARQRHQLAGASAAKFAMRSNTPAFQLAFARRLREEGVPKPSIAKVFTVVFGERWTVERVRTMLEEGT